MGKDLEGHLHLDSEGTLFEGEPRNSIGLALCNPVYRSVES